MSDFWAGFTFGVVITLAPACFGILDRAILWVKTLWAVRKGK